jgi:hypothetical protein
VSECDPEALTMKSPLWAVVPRGQKHSHPFSTASRVLDRNIPSAFTSGPENILVTVVKKDEQTFYVKEVTQNVLFSVRLPIDKDQNFI